MPVNADKGYVSCFKAGSRNFTTKRGDAVDVRQTCSEVTAKGFTINIGGAGSITSSNDPLFSSRETVNVMCNTDR